MSHNHSTHHETALAHDMGLECDGEHSDPHKGSWKGHVLPGFVFILWGAWWAYNCLTYYLWRSARRPYRGRAWYPLALPAAAARALWFLEPALKIVVPAVGLSLELLLDHDPIQYRYLYCPKGTLYTGRFSLSHLNNWQHAASYPAFVLSGLVDIAARHMPLPAGTCQAVLGCAFGIMAFLMGTHEKHEPQDKMVHWLLFVAMLLCTAMVFLEMALRRSMLVGTGKAAALLLQGAWLIQIAAAEFEGRPQWSHDYPGGALFAPVAFCSIAVLILASMLAFYLLLALLSRRGLLLRSPLLPTLEVEEMEDTHHEGEEHVLHNHCDVLPHHHHHHHYVSEHSNNEGEGLLESPLKHRHGEHLVALQLAAKGPANGSV